MLFHCLRTCNSLLSFKVKFMFYMTQTFVMYLDCFPLYYISLYPPTHWSFCSSVKISGRLFSQGHCPAVLSAWNAPPQIHILLLSLPPSSPCSNVYLDQRVQYYKLSPFPLSSTSYFPHFIDNLLFHYIVNVLTYFC